MNSIWILGAGKFGLRAGAELIQKHPHANVLLIDHDPLACRAAQSLGFITEHCDGIAYLSRMLNDSDVVDLIVPAIPVHVIFKWIQNRLLNHFQIEKVPIPASLLAILPNPIKGENHTIYTSNADFQCPENCPEPDRECMVTGKPRPCEINKVLQQYTGIGFQTVVIRSQILAPGVGGFRPRVMFQAFDRIKQSQKPVIISTACSCHGVVDAFQLISSSG